MNDSTLAPEQINLKPIQQLFDQLSESIKTRAYHQIVHDASAAIELVLQSQLLTLFDIRSYAYAKQGRFADAIADAQQMVDYAPKHGAGYARKGCVLSMYGHHRRAIKAYKDGLQYTESDGECVKRLGECKEYATTMNDTRINFIAQLPLELANEVILRLSTGAKTEGLSVSSTWRKRIIECGDTWNDMEINANEKEAQLVSVIPYIGRHVEHMTINTADDTACSACFKHIKIGSFPKIRSLKILSLAAKQFDLDAARISIAASQASKTLTKAVVHFTKNENRITLADLLNTCENLADLSYRTGSSTPEPIRDLETFRRHDALRSLKLKSGTITGVHIEPILKQCQQLRRLVMIGCRSSVFSPIVTYGKNLQILGYNYRSSIPELTGDDDTREQGLRIIYTNDGHTAVRASSILPLLYKHRNTLETVFADISSLSDEELQQFYTRYPDFRFERLTALTCWPFKGIQQFMLRAIQETTTLRFLSMVNVNNMELVVDTLINLPALTTLRLSHVKSAAHCSSLVSLFTRYASLSESQKSLECVKLRFCDGMNDTVLLSLAGIKTLQRVMFCGLKGVKIKGLKGFFSNVGDQLTEVVLAEMDVATDGVIALLGNLRNVKHVELKDLSKVTDEGIRNMLDKESCSIDKLTINGCPLVTFECIQYSRKKVRTLVAK